MKKFFALMLCVPFLIWGSQRIYHAIVLEQNLVGHLKRAANANTVPLALREMSLVVNYLEEHEMTSGYTSIIYRTPDEDLGFFYDNMKSSLEELESVNPEASQLETSNVLMKLRETLVDSGQSTSVTFPDGLSVFPDNARYAIVGTLFSLLALSGIIWFVRELMW